MNFKPIKDFVTLAVTKTPRPELCPHWKVRRYFETSRIAGMLRWGGGGGAIRVKSKQDKQQKLREATPIVVNMQSAPPI